MSETPTERPAKSGGFHLPVLPDDWHYHVRLTGPGNQAINIGNEYGGPTVVGVRTGLEESADMLKTFEVGSLSEGVKQAVAITRTLKDLTAHEEKTRTARAALLEQIGKSASQKDDGELVTPVTGVNVESRGGRGVVFDKGGLTPGLTEARNDTGEDESVKPAGS